LVVDDWLGHEKQIVDCMLCQNVNPFSRRFSMNDQFLNRQKAEPQDLIEVSPEQLRDIEGGCDGTEAGLRRGYFSGGLRRNDPAIGVDPL
jgi:hypothetical protein